MGQTTTLSSPVYVEEEIERQIEEVDAVADSDRGAGGFGSTGLG